MVVYMHRPQGFYPQVHPSADPFQVLINLLVFRGARDARMLGQLGVLVLGRR